MATSTALRELFSRTEFWQAFFRKGMLFLLAVVMCAALVFGVGYYIKTAMMPKFIDRYLPAEGTLGYIELSLAPGSVERQGFWRDAEAGRFGLLPKELWSGSGSHVLQETVGDHMAAAWIRSGNELGMVYFLETKEGLEDYLTSLHTGSTEDPTALSLTGSSFAYQPVDEYIVLSHSPRLLDVVLGVSEEGQPSLVTDTLYQHGRGNLAVHSEGRGYVSLSRLQEEFGNNEQLQGAYRDIYLLLHPIWSHGEQMVWNMSSIQQGWRLSMVVNVEKEFMSYFQGTVKLANQAPFWEGKGATIGLDHGDMSTVLEHFAVYLESSDQPLAQILRSYIGESARRFLGVTSLEDLPALNYGGMALMLDPVSLEPSLVAKLEFETGQEEFFRGVQEQGLPLLLSALGGVDAATLAVELSTQGDTTVTHYMLGTLNVYSSVLDGTWILGLGNEEVFARFLAVSEQHDRRYYPDVRSSSYLLDIQGLSLPGDAPVTATGSFLGSFDSVSGGLRTFDDGIRLDMELVTLP